MAIDFPRIDSIKFNRVCILKTFSAGIFGFLLILAGINHFISPELYLKIMPPYFPAPLPLVYLSGVFEIVLGMALFYPPRRNLVVWGIIALLVAVFPANIYMATQGHLFPEIAPWMLYMRLPLQVLLIFWAWWLKTPFRKPQIQE